MFLRLSIRTFKPGGVRSIGQFTLPQTECRPRPARRVSDPRKCLRRDRGLVLGVYYNEHASEPGLLTAAAARYDRANDGRLWRTLKLAPIPQLGEARVFYDLDPRYAFVAVAGLGSECLAYSHCERLHEGREAVRAAAGAGAAALRPLHPAHIDVESFGDAEAAAEGATLALWQFDEYRSVRGTALPKITAHLHDDCDAVGWRSGELRAEAQNLARYLQELPANILNPTSFAKIAVDVLCELDIGVEVRTMGWAAHREMGGFVSVGKSSVRPPLHVEVTYYGAGERERPVVLVGQGVTFDSGGLDLKPASELRHMRGDMAGAACALAAVRGAARLRLPLNVRAVLPLCELMPCGRSPKFGDVVRSGIGESVLVRRPGREGRLLLGEALAHARTHRPRLLVAVGTVSHDVPHVLGGAACAAYSNCEESFLALESAGARAGDRVWRMPLWQWYARRVRDVQAADVASSGRTRLADSAECAAYLRRFACDARWLHLDTCGVSRAAGGYLRCGMSGRPTRTLLALLDQLARPRPPLQ